MSARIRTLVLATTCWALVLAPTAMAKQASDGGEGTAGELTDKYITFFSLGVLLFFVLVITVLSILQSMLQRRAAERKAAEAHEPVGW